MLVFTIFTITGVRFMNILKHSFMFYLKLRSDISLYVTSIYILNFWRIFDKDYTYVNMYVICLIKMFGIIEMIEKYSLARLGLTEWKYKVSVKSC